MLPFGRLVLSCVGLGNFPFLNASVQGLTVSIPIVHFQHRDPRFGCDVDITDFNFLASNFAPDGYGASAVPEPSSLLLALLGLMLLTGVRGQQAINEHLAHPQGRG